MVVALSASHGQSQPGGGCGIDAIKQVNETLFFRDRTALAVEHVIAIEATGNFLIRRRIRQEVTGDLPDGELIKR